MPQRHVAKALFGLALLLAGAGCGQKNSNADLYDLRGRGPQVGDLIRVETTLSLSNGTAVATEGGQEVRGSAEISGRTIEEAEVLAVSGRDVTKFKQTFILDVEKFHFAFGEPAPAETVHNALEGETVLHELSAGTWKKSLLGKVPSSEQQKQLLSLSSWESDDLMYPDRPVKPGHSWTVEGARLRKLLGPDFLSVSGQASMVFEKMVELEGETCALIAVSLELKGKMLDTENNELQVEIGGTGRFYRSLAKGLDLKAAIQGQMKVQGMIANEGMKVGLELKGPFTLESTSRRR